VLLVSALLGFCWYALVGTNTSVEGGQLNEVLLSEVLLTDSPSLLDSDESMGVFDNAGRHS
jgi:hypothetical protein